MSVLGSQLDHAFEPLRPLELLQMGFHALDHALSLVEQVGREGLDDQNLKDLHPVVHELNNISRKEYLLILVVEIGRVQSYLIDLVKSLAEMHLAA